MGSGADKKKRRNKMKAENAKVFSSEESYLKPETVSKITENIDNMEKELMGGMGEKELMKMSLSEAIKLCEEVAKYPVFKGVDPCGNQGLSLVLSRINSGIKRLEIAIDNL